MVYNSIRVLQFYETRRNGDISNIVVNHGNFCSFTLLICAMDFCKIPIILKNVVSSTNT